jgi:predicted Zn-dependent protease
MNYLGLAHRMLGNYPLALKWIQLALAQDPDHRKSHENLGELYLAMNDPASAQAQLAELVRLCPDSCDERDMLTRAIADSQALRPSAPATPGASAASPQTPPGSHQD